MACGSPHTTPAGGGPKSFRKRISAQRAPNGGRVTEDGVWRPFGRALIHGIWKSLPSVTPSIAGHNSNPSVTSVDSGPVCDACSSGQSDPALRCRSGFARARRPLCARMPASRHRCTSRLKRKSRQRTLNCGSPNCETPFHWTSLRPKYPSRIGRPAAKGAAESLRAATKEPAKSSLGGATGIGDTATADTACSAGLRGRPRFARSGISTTTIRTNAKNAYHQYQ